MIFFAAERDLCDPQKYLQEKEQQKCPPDPGTYACHGKQGNRAGSRAISEDGNEQKHGRQQIRDPHDEKHGLSGVFLLFVFGSSQDLFRADELIHGHMKEASDLL